jgi:type IV secretory pathway TrbD component
VALRRLPIHKSGVRPQLFWGGDRELVLFTLLLVFVCVISMKIAIVLGGLAGGAAVIGCLRLMAKADPLMRFVYLRAYRYRGYYPARSTPWRIDKQPIRWLPWRNR